MEKKRIELSEVNRKIKADAASVVAFAEKSYEEQLVSICDEIAADAETHKVIMLSGPSCSGKTTTALKLEDMLSSRGIEGHTVSMDNFFIHRNELPRLPDGKTDFESVNTLDIGLLTKTLASLAVGKRTGMPVYDFSTGIRRDGAYEFELRHGEIVIMEGLHALNGEIIKRIPADRVFKLYVNVDSEYYLDGKKAIGWRDMRFLRRMVRDARFRHQPPIGTIGMWDGVIHGENEYVIPFISQADTVINTAFEYEPSHLMPYAVPMLETIFDTAYGEYARGLHKTLSGLCGFDEKLIPAESLVREFTGGSAYSESNGAK